MKDEINIGDVVYIVEDFNTTVDYFRCEVIDKNELEFLITSLNMTDNKHTRAIYRNQKNRFITKNKTFAIYVFLAGVLKNKNISTLNENIFLLNIIKAGIGIPDIEIIKSNIRESLIEFPEKWI